MNIEHIKNQFKRLERHHNNALKDKDSIAFLDLSHTLRIWCDMKADVDEVISKQKSQIRFKHLIKNKKVEEIFGSGNFIQAPLASGVDSPGIRVSNVRFIDRALSDEEVETLYKMGRQTDQYTHMTFTQWLGAGVMQVSINITGAPSKVWLSREMLIKRVANVFGGSHPQKNNPENQNKFDPYIEGIDKLNIEVADGYKLIEYQLLEISQHIIKQLGEVFDQQPSEKAIKID